LVGADDGGGATAGLRGGVLVEPSDGAMRLIHAFIAAANCVSTLTIQAKT